MHSPDSDSRDGPHPQDVLIQQILEKIVFEKYGTDINSLYKQQARKSKFDEALKKFYSPAPFYKINFEDYQEELLKCIQYGTNPVFGYPLIRFEERRNTLTDVIKEVPEQLNDKFRRGLPRRKKSEEVQREEITQLTEKILKKQKYMEEDQIDQYYEEERADKRREKWEPSHLKNLPSPIFKVIAKSHSQYVHRVIKEKQHQENSLKRVEEMMAKGRPVNLSKCQVEADESLCSTSEYKNKRNKPKLGGRLFSKPTMRKSIYKKGGRALVPGNLKSNPTPGTKGSSNFVRQINIFGEGNDGSALPSKQPSFHIKGKSINSPSISESRGSKDERHHDDFMSRMIILNKKNTFIDKKSSMESSPDTSPNSKYKYLTQRQLKNTNYDSSSMQKHQSQPTNFDGDLNTAELITVGKTQKTSPKAFKQSQTIVPTKPQSVSMNIRKRSKGKQWDRINSANPVAASSMVAKGRTGKRLKRNNWGGMTNSSKKGYESFNFANQKTTSIFQKNKYTSNTSTNRQIALQIAESGKFPPKKIEDSESRLNQESTNKSTEGFLLTSGVKSSLIAKGVISATKSTLKVNQRENLESEADQPARQSPLTSQPKNLRDDETEPSNHQAMTYISRKSLKVQSNDRLCLSDLAGVLPRRKKSTSNRKSRSPHHDKSHLRLDEMNSNLLNCSINDLKGVTAVGKKNSNLFQLRNQASTQANTFKQYSSGCISRSDLKFRLKTQKLCQRKIFRNTLRDLSKYVDPKSPVMGTETTQMRFHVGNSLSGLDYQNLLKSSVTNPLITPPLMATNRGSKKEDPIMLYANSAAPRNYQCYSQMNDSNHFGYGIDYSESGYSVNIKSNRGISEKNWVGQQEPIVASAGGLQKAASPLKENLLCQIYSSDYSQTASRNKLFQVNSNKHTDPENTTPKLVSSVIRGNATVGTRGSQKMKFIPSALQGMGSSGNQIQEVSLSSVGTLQKKRGSKQLLKHQPTSASSTTAGMGHFGSQQPLIGGSSANKKLSFPKKQFVKPRILSGKQIFQLNPTEQPMTSPSFAHSSPHPKTSSEYIPHNELSQPIYRTTEEDDGDLTYYSKASGVKRIFKQRFEDIKEMPNESAMSGVPIHKKKKKRLNSNFRADNFQTESGNLANLEVSSGMPQRQNSHQHQSKPTPFFSSQQQLSQDQIQAQLNDRSLLSLTQDQNDYMNGLNYTQTEGAQVGTYHFGFGPGDISLGTTMGGNLRSDVDILDNSRWINNNSFQQFGQHAVSQKNTQMSPNTTSKNTLMVQGSDNSPFRQSSSNKPRRKSRKKKKFTSGNHPKTNSRFQVGEVTCTQTPPNKQPPMKGEEK